MNKRVASKDKNRSFAVPSRYAAGKPRLRMTARFVFILTSGFWLLASAAHAQTLVQIADTLYNADGSTANGRMVISWDPFTTSDNATIDGGTISYTIPASGVDAGKIDVSLAPNIGAIPSGTSYRVRYYLANGASYLENWVVPASGPATIAQVRTLTTPIPIPTVNLSQVVGGTASRCARWNSSGVLSSHTGDCGAGGGGGGHTVEEEGTPLASRTNLNFVGGAITATDDALNDQTDVTVVIDDSTVPNNITIDLATLATTATTATTANAGDSATGFFSTGAIEVAVGGTGAAPTAGDQVLTSDSISGATWKTVPDCNTNNLLTYTAATNTWGCEADDGAGGGAPIGVQYVVGASDATLTAEKILTDGAGIDTVLAGADGGTATIGLDYAQTLAGNPALAVSAAIFSDDCPGGGFLSEGSTANTNEQLHCFISADGADTTGEITENAATQTLTNKTITAANNAVEADDLICTNCIGPTEITDLTLGTDTAGNYLAAVTGDTEIVVTGAAGEGATQALSIASTITRDTELISAAVNAQVGTTYTYLTTDVGKLVTHTNAGAIAATLPVASGAGFTSGFFMDVQNRGAGTLTITPTTSTIDGAASLALTTGQGVRIFSDSTNYFTQRGVGGAGGGAPTDATYITQTANGSLSAEQALSALASGIMRVATTTGVITSLGDVLPVANGGLNLSAATDNNTPVGNGTTWESKTLPDCPDTTGNHLNFNQATNTYSCGATSGGGGSSSRLLATGDFYVLGSGGIQQAFSSIQAGSNTAGAMLIEKVWFPGGVVNNLSFEVTTAGVGTTDQMEVAIYNAAGTSVVLRSGVLCGDSTPSVSSIGGKNVTATSVDCSTSTQEDAGFGTDFAAGYYWRATCSNTTVIVVRAFPASADISLLTNADGFARYGRATAQWGTNTGCPATLPTVTAGNFGRPAIQVSR